VGTRGSAFASASTSVVSDRRCEDKLLLAVAIDNGSAGFSTTSGAMMADIFYAQWTTIKSGSIEIELDDGFIQAAVCTVTITSTASIRHFVHEQETQLGGAT